MVLIPAQCQNPKCGFMFQPQGGIEASGATNLTMSNNRTNCPKCGGAARFIDGEMNVHDGAIELLSGPAWSRDLLEELRLTLVRVVRDAPDDPIAEVESVSSVLGKRLRRNTEGWTRDQKLKLMQLILTSLSIFLGISLTDMDIDIDVNFPDVHIGDTNVTNNNEPTQSEMDRLVQDAIEKVREQDATVPRASTPIRTKTGRNALCPCESGKKFKRCHGDPTKR